MPEWGLNPVPSFIKAQSHYWPLRHSPAVHTGAESPLWGPETLRAWTAGWDRAGPSVPASASTQPHRVFMGALTRDRAAPTLGEGWPAWRISRTEAAYSPWSHKELDITEQLILTLLSKLIVYLISTRWTYMVNQIVIYWKHFIF